MDMSITTGRSFTVSEFIAAILDLNQSILTLSDGSIFDLNSPDAEFRVGYARWHEEELAHRLNQVAQEGSVVVREFDRDSPVAIRNGDRIVRIPSKNIFHFIACGGRIHSVRADISEQSHNTCAVTGRKLDPEPGVRFRDML